MYTCILIHNFPSWVKVNGNGCEDLILLQLSIGQIQHTKEQDVGLFRRQVTLAHVNFVIFLTIHHTGCLYWIFLSIEHVQNGPGVYIIWMSIIFVLMSRDIAGYWAIDG